MNEVVTKQDLKVATDNIGLALDNLGLRLTVRLGGIVVIGVGVLAALMKLT